MVILAVGQFSSCKKGAAAQKDVTVQEDSVAKQMLQGIWVDEDEQDVAFKAQGDSIFYPDSTSMPVRFQIIADTLVLHGASDVKYPILKQTRHLFVFRNQNGDEIRLVLSDDADDANFFSDKHPQPLNQGKLIKRDTIVSFQNKSYHCYIQINPTTYKVIKSSWNDEGVEVDNVYYDNIINLNVYSGARRLYHSDIKRRLRNKTSGFLSYTMAAHGNFHGPPLYILMIIFTQLSCLSSYAVQKNSTQICATKMRRNILSG